MQRSLPPARPQADSGGSAAHVHGGCGRGHRGTRVAGAALGRGAGLGMGVRVGSLPCYGVRGYGCATCGWGRRGSISAFAVRLGVSIAVLSAQMAGFPLSCTTPSAIFHRLREVAATKTAAATQCPVKGTQRRGSPRDAHLLLRARAGEEKYPCQDILSRQGEEVF